jgi:hypothetical protein
MAEIQRKQIFPFPVKRCFEGLLRVLPVMEIQVKKSDPEKRTVEGHWSPGGGAKMVIRADCRENEAGLTELTLRHDMQWTPVLSRPNIKNEIAAHAFDERVLAKMDGILETLGKYLTDESSLPKMTPGMGLDLDHLAWITGAIVSIGLRYLAGRFGLGWLPGSTNTGGGQESYLRILGVAGVLIGGVVAGLIKRRNPLKGNAFFEGMVVALANVWMSIFIYKGLFTRGCLDWGVYGLTGLTAAALVSMKFSRSDSPA